MTRAERARTADASDRMWQAASGAAVFLAVFTPGALADPPLTLVYETRVTLDLQLVLDRAGEPSLTRVETMTGLAGERVIHSELLETDDGPLAVGIVAVGRPDDQSGQCALRLETTVQPRGGSPVSVARDAELETGRLLLTEIWGDERRGLRLMLATSVSWERVPTLTTLVPGAEPFEVIVEVYLGQGADGELVERHRLGGIVGSPIRYAFRQIPGAGPATDSASSGELVLEITPLSIDAGKADLDVSLRHEGRSPYSSVEAMSVGVRERLAPGHAISVPLPASAESPPLLFRITPYF